MPQILGYSWFTPILHEVDCLILRMVWVLWFSSLLNIQLTNPWARPSVQFSSVAQSCPTICDPLNCSTPGLPVHHQRPEFTQTHVHRVSDAIQPSHPLSSPSPPALNPSQHQGLFQWVSSLHQVAKVLEFSFSISPSNEHPGLISFRMDWLDLLPISILTLKAVAFKAVLLKHKVPFSHEALSP